MYLSLNKWTSKYGKTIVLIIYVHCIKLEVRLAIFPFMLSIFFSVINATNFFVYSLNWFVLEKNCLHVAGLPQPGALYANKPFKCW